MKVSLVRHTADAYETSVASARTCYAADPVLPEEVSSTRQRRQVRDAIAASTLAAGHLTTRQHAHFTFLIQGVSRGVVWSFLHSHPHYNSEQVSQRYVPVKPEAFVMPPGLDGEELANWCDLVAYQVKAYQQVAASLFPSVREEYFDRRPARRQKADEHETAIRRLCLEDARYLLPQSVKANLYHTVSALTLLRYLRLAKRYEFADETTELCRQMLDCVLEVDPLFDKDVERVEDSEDPWALDEEGDLPWEIDSARMAIKSAYSMLLDVSGAIDLDDPLLVGAMDPAGNSILLDNLGLQAMDRRTQITEFVHFTFLKALSLTADAQSQRHRAIRRYQTALPDVFPSPERIRTPVKVARCETTRRLYEDHVSEITLRGRSLHSVDPAPIHYTLPNGFVTHFIETGSLAGFAHRWKMRLCLLAQDEIRQAAEEEVRDVMGLGELQGIGAPCHIRHRGGVRPPCPEGDRFCGVRVWETPVGGPAT